MLCSMAVQCMHASARCLHTSPRCAVLLPTDVLFVAALLPSLKAEWWNRLPEGWEAAAAEAANASPAVSAAAASGGLDGEMAGAAGSNSIKDMLQKGAWVVLQQVRGAAVGGQHAFSIHNLDCANHAEGEQLLWVKAGQSVGVGRKQVMAVCSVPSFQRVVPCKQAVVTAAVHVHSSSIRAAAAAAAETSIVLPRA